MRRKYLISITILITYFCLRREYIMIYTQRLIPRKTAKGQGRFKVESERIQIAMINLLTDSLTYTTLFRYKNDKNQFIRYIYLLS